MIIKIINNYVIILTTADFQPIILTKYKQKNKKKSLLWLNFAGIIAESSLYLEFCSLLI
jgi:hypothetical protein